MVENTIHSRLKKILEDKNFNYASFGKKLGYSDVVVRNIVTGKNMPSYSFIISLAQTFLWINLEWLILGEGEMEKKESFEIASEVNSHYIRQSQKCELCEIKDMLIKSQQEQITHLKEELLRKQKLIR